MKHFVIAIAICVSLVAFAYVNRESQQIFKSEIADDGHVGRIAIGRGAIARESGDLVIRTNAGTYIGKMTRDEHKVLSALVRRLRKIK